VPISIKEAAWGWSGVPGKCRLKLKNIAPEELVQRSHNSLMHPKPQVVRSNRMN
jgi:hypothetical protein